MKKSLQSEIERSLYGRRGSKYGAKRTNGYASKREATVAAQLQALQRGGQISELKEQVKFELLEPQKGQIRNEKGIAYIADFSWLDKKGVRHVADAKGCKTSTYIIKRKLMLFVHKIEIEEL